MCALPRLQMSLKIILDSPSRRPETQFFVMNPQLVHCMKITKLRLTQPDYLTGWKLVLIIAGEVL